MAQRNSRASVGRDENVLGFPPASAPDKGATALDLVYQAADVFRSMEEHARETEARAQSLCTSALERLRLAEVRAEAAERAQRGRKLGRNQGAAFLGDFDIRHRSR